MSSPPAPSPGCTALHPMVQGITGPEPHSVQGPPPSKREGERERVKS